MRKIGGYIALAIIAGVGIYSVGQLNSVSDVIAETNRQQKADRLAGKAAAAELETEIYLSEGNTAPEAQESEDWGDDAAVEEGGE